MQAVSRSPPTAQVIPAVVIFWPTLSGGVVRIGHPVPSWKLYGPRSVGSDVGDPTAEQPSFPRGASSGRPGSGPAQLTLTCSPGWSGCGTLHWIPSGVTKYAPPPARPEAVYGAGSTGWNASRSGNFGGSAWAVQALITAVPMTAAVALKVLLSTSGRLPSVGRRTSLSMCWGRR